MIENLRTQTMNLPAMNSPRGGLPAFNGKALIPVVIVTGLVVIVIVRASAMLQSPGDVKRTAQLMPAVSAECENNVWPYVTSGCLQGAAASENVRVVVGHPPPDAQTQMREAEARYNAAMRPQKRSKREYNEDMPRERRDRPLARRNVTFF